MPAVSGRRQAAPDEVVAERVNKGRRQRSWRWEPCVPDGGRCGVASRIVHAHCPCGCGSWTTVTPIWLSECAACGRWCFRPVYWRHAQWWVCGSSAKRRHVGREERQG